MNILEVPYDKIQYINFSKDVYNEEVYNYMRIELAITKKLSAGVNFSWMEKEEAPLELLEFIKMAGLNLNNLLEEK